MFLTTLLTIQAPGKWAHLFAQRLDARLRFCLVLSVLALENLLVGNHPLNGCAVSLVVSLNRHFRIN